MQIKSGLDDSIFVGKFVGTKEVDQPNEDEKDGEVRRLSTKKDKSSRLINCEDDCDAKGKMFEWKVVSHTAKLLDI